MKMFKRISLGVVFSALMVTASLWANEEGAGKIEKGKSAHEAKIKAIKDAATALQQTQPVLAKELSAYAAEEEALVAEWKAKKESHTKLLKDSAAALQTSHPDLSKGLQEAAEGKRAVKKEPIQKQEWKAKVEAHQKLLTEAAAALQTSNPDLAKKLQEMCGGCHKKAMPKGKSEEKKQ